MKKLYPVIFLLCFLLCQKESFGQCSVTFSPNTTQLDCNVTSITLSIDSFLTNNHDWVYYYWDTCSNCSSVFVPSITVTHSGTYKVSVSNTKNLICEQTVVITQDTTHPTVAVSAPTALCSETPVTLTATGADTYQWTLPDSSTQPTITDTPVNNTSYTVIGTNTSNGCTDIFTYKLVVNPLPDASISIINQSSCQYNTANPPQVIFTGTNGNRPYTFAYTVNGIPAQVVTKNGNDTAVITVPTDGSLLYETFYDLTSVTDSNGCTHAIQGTQAEVVSNILPTPLLTSTKDTGICSGAHFTYTATSSTPGLNVFYWTRPNVAGISASGPGNSGGANPAISDTLINTTSQPKTVNYIFTLTTDFCSTTATVQVTVNPTPATSISALPDSLCRGGSAVLTASGASIYHWLNSPSTNPSLPVTPTFTTLYKVIGFNEYNCSDTSTYNLIVKPSPSVRILAFPDTTVCSGSSATLIATGADTYHWQSNSLKDTIVVTPETTTTYTVIGTDSATGCIDTKQLTLAVRPLPEASISSNRSSGCQYSTIDRPQITFTGSIGKPPYLFGYTDNDGNQVFIPSKGSSNTATISVPTGDSGSFTYRLTSVSDSNGCTQKIENREVVVRVFPSPVLTSLKNPASICSDSLFTYKAESSIDTATFFWTRLVKDGLSASGPAVGSTAIIKDTLTNNKLISDTVSYIFTLSVADGNCPKTDTVKVVVNPLPVLTSSKDTNVCSGTKFTYIASSIPGTSFSWTRLANTNISTNEPGIGSGNIITATFTNHTLQPDTVSYVFTLTLGGGCSKIETVHFIVNPTDSIYNKPPKDTAVCSGSLFTYTAKSLLQEQGTKFSWSRDSVAGISNPAKINIPGREINDTLINLTDTIKKVTYIFTLTTETNCSTTEEITVMVNPTDILDDEKKKTSICSTVPFNYPLTSKIEGTTFTWTRDRVPDILPASDSSSGYVDSIKDTLTNLGTTPVDVTDTITLITLKGCRSKDYIVVTVKPAPVVNNISDTTFCNRISTGGIGFTSPTPGASITWESDGTNVGFNETKGGESIPPFMAVNPGTSLLFTTVKVKVSGGVTGCTSADFPFKINVNPTPKVTNILNRPLCNRESVSDGIRFESKSENTSITWQSVPDIGFGDTLGRGNIPPFVANNTNNTTVSADIAIHITDTATQCTGDTTFRIIVNPTPVLINKLTNSVCSGSLFTDTVGSSVLGTSYTWTRQAMTGVLETEIVKNDNAINETLTLADTILRPVAVTYDFELTTGDKCRTDTSVIVTINPSPKINHISDAKFCNGEVARSGISFNSPTPNSSFTWHSSINFGFKDTTGNDSIPEFTASNLTATPDTATVTVTITDNSNTCTADSTFAIIVNPTPTITKPADTIFCSQFKLSDSIKFTSPTMDTLFVWKSSMNIGFGDTGRGKGIDTLFTTIQTSVPRAAAVTVRVLSNSAGCPSADSTFTITINPAPNKPTFNSLSGMTPNGETLSLCKASENINFSVTDPQDSSTGISYHWTSTLASPEVDIKSKDYPNTVITFNDVNTTTIKVTAQYQNSTCVSVDSQVVVVKDQTINVSKQKIFPKQPGNLLIYPDNSLPGSTDSTSGYQWGYDKVLSPNSLNIIESTAVPGQVYQFYIPNPASCGCIKDNDSLNTDNFYYWVLLKDGKGCATKVYYNGPFDDKPDSVRLPNPISNILLQVIPNPNSGVFNISLDGNMYGNIEAQIYNSAGQLVFRKKFVKTNTKTTEKFITGGLPAGVYFVVLKSSDLKQVRSRFIISH